MTFVICLGVTSRFIIILSVISSQAMSDPSYRDKYTGLLKSIIHLNENRVDTMSKLFKLQQVKANELADRPLRTNEMSHEIMADDRPILVIIMDRNPRLRAKKINKRKFKNRNKFKRPGKNTPEKYKKNVKNYKNIRKPETRPKINFKTRSKHRNIFKNLVLNIHHQTHKNSNTFVTQNPESDNIFDQDTNIMNSLEIDTDYDSEEPTAKHYIRTKTNTKRDTENYLNSLNLSDKKLKMLRKSWRSSCDKKAAKVCKKACKSASNMACKNYKCKKGLKRQFQKECKRSCNDKFISKSSSKTDSDSASSGER